MISLLDDNHQTQVLQQPRMRCYSTELGRWINRDPANELGQILLDFENPTLNTQAIQAELTIAYFKLLNAASVAASAGIHDVSQKLLDIAVEIAALRDRIATGRGDALEDAAAYLFVMNSSGSLIDPFGLQPKDKRYGLPDRFWRWYHRNRKEKGDPDLDRDQAMDEYQDWKDLGIKGRVVC